MTMVKIMSNATIDKRREYKEEEVLSDELLKSPHRKRDNLSKRKRDNLEEGIKIWTSFYRLNI